MTNAQLSKSVVYLHSPSIRANEEDIGTGFIVKVIKISDGTSIDFLVTAAHVASLMQSSALITFSSENDIPRTVKITEATGTQIEPQWVTHPKADVAVLPLNPTAGVKSLFSEVALPFDQLFPPDLQAPVRDCPLTIIGFPLGLGGAILGEDRKISPISKETKVSSGLISSPRSDNNVITEFFITDSPSVGGFSGAPAFYPDVYTDQGAFRTFKARFVVGLVHGTLSDATGGKFALLVPEKFIYETILKAAQIAFTGKKALDK